MVENLTINLCPFLLHGIEIKRDKDILGYKIYFYANLPILYHQHHGG